MVDILRVEEIVRRCEELADPAYRENVRPLLNTAWRIIGIRTPALRAMARELSPAVSGPEDLHDLLDYLDDAFDTKIIEPVTVGLLVLERKKKF